MLLQQLRAFVVAARHRNVTKAAHELHISQPGLSKQLKRLEETYRVKLLVRSGMGVDLTPEGMEFLSYVAPILAHLEKLDGRFLKRSKPSDMQALRIGGTYALAISVLPGIVGQFKRPYPDVDVVLRANVHATLEQMLLKGSLDLIVTSRTPAARELAAEPCMSMEIVVVVAKGYPLPKHKLLQLAEFGRLPLIVHSSPDRKGVTETFLRALRDHGINANILMRCDSPAAIKTAVLNKLGAGILYYDVVKNEIIRGMFKRVRITDFSLEAQSYVVYHSQRPLSASADAFLTILRKQCASSTHTTRTKVQSVPDDVSLERLLLPLLSFVPYATVC